MTREKALARATALIALATDEATTEAEARTVALRACKLVDEHGLLSPEPEPERGRIDNDDIRRATEVGRAVFDEFMKWQRKVKGKRR